jgi:outer membrane protein assembly factor BamB
MTALDGEKLVTLCLDRATGRVLWRREAPRGRKQEMHVKNHPASPSPVSDGQNVYSFFTDFGLISYGPDGNERWRLPLGPFNNPFGMGASPVLAGDTLLQICDSESGSFFVAVDARNGRLKWRVERPEFTRGFSTPVLYKSARGLQAIVAGSYELISYSVETGERVWWTTGLTWQLKPTPVMGDGVVYVLGWAGGSDTGQQEDVGSFSDALARLDTDKDGRIAKSEAVNPQWTKAWREMDLDDDGHLGERDWRFYRTRRQAQNGLNAFRLDGHGDVSGKALLWRYTKSLPNAPSPLLYRNVLYLLKDGGIFTSIDPATGEVIKQGRLEGAVGAYFSSPTGADGKIYTLSEDGRAAVIRAGGNWELLGVNDLGEDCYASPAIVDGKIYLRTRGYLYCFAAK